MAKNISNHLRNHYSNYNLLFLKRYFDQLNIKENKILDVGTGHYRNLKLFSEVGFKNLWGIDKNIPDPIPYKNFKVNFTINNIETGLPYSPKMFDVVLCNYVLMFIEPSRLNFVLDELFRVSKSNGFIIIETFRHPVNAKTTEVKQYDFQNIVSYFESRHDIEILDVKNYYEKLLVRRVLCHG